MYVQEKSWYVNGLLLSVVSGIHQGFGTSPLQIRGKYYANKSEIKQHFKRSKNFPVPKKTYQEEIQYFYTKIFRTFLRDTKDIEEQSMFTN